MSGLTNVYTFEVNVLILYGADMNDRTHIAIIRYEEGTGWIKKKKLFTLYN